MPTAPVQPEALAALQSRLGHTFRDPKLLACALTHPSVLQNHAGPAGENNQRLEFLGDAVIQLILSEELFRQFPLEREGTLSRRRAMLGNGPHLARLAREIGLDRCLKLGASEEAAGGRTRDAALEDAFEAVMGAVHQDAGFDATRRIVLAAYGDLAKRLASLEGHENPKGRLQEQVQPVHGNQALRYEVTQATGPDHAREYEVAVFVLDRRLGSGKGPSKKLAEEEAARAALATFAPPASPGPA